MEVRAILKGTDKTKFNQLWRMLGLKHKSEVFRYCLNKTHKELCNPADKKEA